MGTNRASVLAAGWVVIGAIAFTLSSAAAKWVGVRLPPAEVAFFRALAAAIVVAILFRRAAVDWRQARYPMWYAVRIVTGVLSLVCFIYSVTVVPIAVAQLLLLTRVLLMPAVALALLGEPLSGRLAAASIMGLVGAGVTVWPALQPGGQLLGVLAALGASLGTAVSQTAVRRLGATNSAAMIVCVYGIGSAVALGPIAGVTGWVTPPESAWGALALLGLAAAVAQYAAVAAFKLGPVAFVAPLDVIGIPIAAALGFALFGDVPTAYDLAGAVLIIGASWYVIAVGAPGGDISPRVSPG